LIALVGAIFLASVLGSFHCAGMCGAFLAIATGPRASWHRAAALQGVYHFGRLLSYISLGAAVGSLGKLLNVTSALAGIRPLAAGLAGITMVLFGITTLLRSHGVAIQHLHLPKSWMNVVSCGHRFAMNRPAMLRAFAIGLLTTMLPCGWLYAFAVTAAGTGSPARGAIAMAAFWTGTLPALVAVGAGLRGVLGVVGKQLPTLTVIAMVMAGVFTLVGRAQLDPTVLAKRIHLSSTVPTTNTQPCCESMTLTADLVRPSIPVEPVACAHCGLVVPDALIQLGVEHQFCCTGCEAVFQTLHACGLDAYYRLRDLGDSTFQPAHPSNDSFLSFDTDAFHQLYVQSRNDGALSVDLTLEGVTCAACVWLFERLPRVLPGIIDARLSLREAIVRVTWDPRQIKLSRIAQSLDKLGYTPHAARSELGREAHRKEARKRLIHVGVAGAIMGNVMLLALALYAGSFGNMDAQYRMFFRWISAGLAMISLCWPGATFFRSAWTAIRMRTTNLDVPIALALAVGGTAGFVNVVLNRGEIYFDSLCVLIFLLLVGRFIQYRQQRWADDAVGLLFNLTPRSCQRVEDGRVIDIPAEALVPGDLVQVRAGDLFPADGVVLSGTSSINTAMLTGESMPALIAPGSSVHAGAQNIGSVVRFTVQSVGGATRIGKLMRLVEDGIREKPAIVQFADRVGKWFVVAITVVAVATFAFWSRISLPLAIDHTVALLIVTCPCVLGLATPLTIAIAIGRLARRDILVKNGVALEQLSRGGSLLLDKTGTLTEGKLRVLNWYGSQSARALVARAEENSNHPVGRALAHLGQESHANDQLLSDIIERGDGGLSARIGQSFLHIGSPAFARRKEVDISSSLQTNIKESESTQCTTVVVAIDRTAVAIAALGDALRSDSPSAVNSLRELNFAPEILSGDAAPVVSNIAKQVQVEPERTRRHDARAEAASRSAAQWQTGCDDRRWRERCRCAGGSRRRHCRAWRS